MVSEKAMIIAEIGQNHLGNMDLARQLIWVAKECGADLVKFQLYDHNQLYANHPEIPDVALSFDQAKMLFDYGKGIGIEVFFSVFDVERVKWCEEIGVKKYKISSMMRDRDVWRAISFAGKPVIISYPAPSSESYPFGISKASHLYCPRGYPQKELILELVNQFQGFSDHTIGLDTSKIALARGAKIVEKHFAIDHKTGIDARWSMTPLELKELRRWVNVCGQCL